MNGAAVQDPWQWRHCDMDAVPQLQLGGILQGTWAVTFLPLIIFCKRNSGGPDRRKRCCGGGGGGGRSSCWHFVLQS